MADYRRRCDCVEPLLRGLPERETRRKGGGENVAVERSIETTDFSDTDLSVAIRSTTPLEIAFLIMLVDTHGNWAALHLRGITCQPPDVCWFRTCPGVFGVSDTPPDFTRIDRIRLKALNASPDDATVWVDDLRTHPKPENGYVIFTWDDGRSDYYDTAAPIHDEYDIPGIVTMPPTTKELGAETFMSLAEFTERSEAGDEVVGHGSVGHTFNTVSRSKLDALLERKKRWLVENDFDGSEFVIYPANNYDKTALDVVGKYFLMGGMNQAGNVNTTGVHGFDPLVLPRTIGHDLGISKTAVDKAGRHRNCSILNFHRFKNDNTMNPPDYRRLVEYVAEHDGVEAITFSDLWAMRTDGTA